MNKNVLVYAKHLIFLLKWLFEMTNMGKTTSWHGNIIFLIISKLLYK
jgi:hypothetical protein